MSTLAKVIDNSLWQGITIKVRTKSNARMFPNRDGHILAIRKKDNHILVKLKGKSGPVSYPSHELERIY